MVVWSLVRLLLRTALIHQSTRRFLQNWCLRHGNYFMTHSSYLLASHNWCLRHGNDFMTHSSYLLASPTDGFAKAQLMSQCLPYHPTDLSPYLPYLPYQRLKPCSPCQALLTQSPFIESLINPSCNRTI